MSQTGKIALWTLLAVAAAGASWVGYDIGFQLAQAPQQPQRAIVIVHTTPTSVICVPATACSIKQGNPP